MNAITKDAAVEIALRYAKDRELASFEFCAAYLCENEDGSIWNVILSFVKELNDTVGLPTDVTIHVDSKTGRVWSIMSL